MNLQDKFRAFSERGCLNDGTRFNAGMHCHKLSWPIVKAVDARVCVERTFSDDYTLPKFVAYATQSVVGYDFAWPKVMRILDHVGREGNMSEYTLRSYEEMHPRAVRIFLSADRQFRPLRFKFREMAKLVLFVEALSFLEAEGYDDKILDRKRAAL